MKNLKKLGIHRDESGKITFYEGECSRGILSKHKLATSGKDFLYYKNNHWMKLEEQEVKKICKNEFDMIDKNSWKLSYECRYLPTLKIDAPRFKVTDLNRFPFKINFDNGVYNFKTQDFEEHDESNYFTYIKDYSIFKEVDETPLFDELIELASNGRKELADYLMEFIAYIVSGNKTEQKFFILKGKGKNGKSTLINLLTKLLGIDFVTSISLSKLGEKFTLSSAVGKKLIVASENEKSNGSEVPTEMLKMISSGKELVRIEGKYENGYSTNLELELVFALNNVIKFAETSDGLRRRLVVIPFDGVIKKIDPTFEERLEQEIPAIMRKLIERYNGIAQRGYKLQNSEIIDKATEDFLAEGERENMGNGVFDFFQEELVIDQNKKVSKNEVYERYIGIKGLSSSTTKFWLDFKKWTQFRNVEVKEIRNGVRLLCGIGLKDTQNKYVSNDNEDNFDNIFGE